MKKQKQRYNPPNVYASFSHPNNSIATLVYNHAFQVLSLNSIYVSFDCKEPHNITAAIRNLNIKGASISMPHKENVLKYIDEFDEHVSQIRAVNVITNENGKLRGHNTDWIGAVKSIDKHISLLGKSVAILGAGGAARAIAYGLMKQNCKVYILNRDKNKAVKIVNDFMLENAGSIQELNLIESSDIIINATPLGSSYDTNSDALESLQLNKNQVILDIVISQYDTPLITKAKKTGCNYSTGIDMYINQALGAFELFTKQKITELTLRNSLSNFF